MLYIFKNEPLFWSLEMSLFDDNYLVWTLNDLGQIQLKKKKKNHNKQYIMTSSSKELI